MGAWARLWDRALRDASRQPGRGRPPPQRSRAFPHDGSAKRLPDPNLCVYIIGFEDPNIRPIKIGVTNNLQKRLQTLQTGCPWRLEVKGVTYTPSAYGEERWLHEHFGRHRIRPDGEWFMPPDHVEDVVAWVGEA